MNFERPYTEEPDNEEKLIPNTSRRAFIKTALGATTSALLTKGVIEVLPKFEKEEEKNAPFFVKVKEPIEQELESPKIEVEEVPSTNPQNESLRNIETRETIDWKEFKNIKPDLGYEQIVPEPKIENLRLPNDVSKYGATTHTGKMIRTLRYKNVTDAVEDRYNLPSGILLAMIMEESTGVDLLPNARGDGGFGLSHMQGSTSAEYGLKTFHECDALVCNGKDPRSCKNEQGELQNHAAELATFMKAKAGDRKALVEADERLHILLNIDATGRMLAAGIASPELKGNLSDLGPLRRAIARYAGAYNYSEYWKDICKNMRDLEDPEVLKKIEQEFNKANPSLKINKEKADFKKYLEVFQTQHVNYGLNEYKELPKYLPKNSEQVMSSYREYLIV